MALYAGTSRYLPRIRSLAALDTLALYGELVFAIALAQVTERKVTKVRANKRVGIGQFLSRRIDLSPRGAALQAIEVIPRCPKSVAAAFLLML